MQLRCRDVSVDCDFEVKGVSSEEEALQIAALHARMAHKMDEIPPELIEKVKKAVSR